MQKMEKDFLSRLPEELIHHILGFLTTKDAVKVSLLSNSLQASWLSSCPSLHFHEKDFLFEHPGEPLHRNLERFHKYVFNTMARVSNHRITSFQFQTSYLRDSETLDKWIGIALDGFVGEIYLSVRGVPHCLPERLFVSSSFLKSLHLDVWGKSKLSFSGAAVDINLPCLQSLTLIRVSIDEESLQRLLKGCPSLEHLEIKPTELLSQLNIYHLKLKSLSLDTASIFNKALAVEVEAPCLEEFHFSDTSTDQTNLTVKCTSNLKCLYLSSRNSKELLSELLPKCTSLETLGLDLWYQAKTIFKISSPYVKNIIIDYISPTEIQIDCPMLLSLRWAASDSNIARGGRSLPSLSVINRQPNFAGHLHMPCLSHTELNTAWFHKLRKFLSTSRMATMSLLCLSSHSEEKTKNGDIKSLPTSAVKIELLYLMVISGLPKSCYTFIMNGLLSACHPDTIHLAEPQSEEGKEPGRKEPVHFIEFFLEKLESWKDADGCYCSSKIQCWKHQLKRVEIEEFSKVENKECHRYDFGISNANLPILDAPPSFRLKFQWY